MFSLPRPLLLLAALLPAAPARAGDLSVSLTTLFRAYDYVDLTGETLRFRALSPTLTASATELLGGQLDFAASARRIESFEASSEDRNDLVYAVLTWRDPSRRFSLSAGRQFESQGPGFTRYDGVRAGVRASGLDLGVKLGIGFERDGRKHQFGRYLGADLTFKPARWLTLGSAFERGSDEGVEYLYKYSADLALRPVPAVTLRGSYLFNAAVGEMDEALATLEWRPGRGPARLELEAGRIHPHFDPDSIWNVFNSGPYDRFSTRLYLPLGEGREVWGRYERREYWQTLAGNLGRAEPAERSAVDTASFGYQSAGDRPLRYSFELFLHSGFGGFRAGAALRIGTELGFLPGRIEAGIDLRAYNRGLRDSRQDLTTAYWSELVLRLGRHARIRCRLEDYRNGFLLDDFRVTLKLDLTSEEHYR